MKSRIYFAVSALFFIANTVFAGAQEKAQDACGPSSINTHPENWKNSEIANLLKTGKVLSKRPMRERLESLGKKAEFDGDVFFIELDNGLKAVFKKIPIDDLGDAYAEVAAYQASIVLGFPNIPPTIITEIEGDKGSLQLYVETNIDALRANNYESALKEALPEDVSNLKLFYFIFGQWDSGPHNILIFKDKKKTYLIAIDNSGIRNHQYVNYGSLPFVRIRYSDKLRTNDWHKPFPFERAKAIQDPTAEKLQTTFGDMFPEEFYRSFKSYKLPYRYVIYRNSLWRQFHAGDEKFVISFTNFLPPHARKKFEGLDLAVLRKIFSCAKNADFLTSDYLKGILERRDQVLRYFNKPLNKSPS